MFIILFAVLIISFTAIPCNTNASITVLNPATDGHYHYYYSSCALCPPENCEGSDCEVLEIEIENKIKVEGTYWRAPGHGARIRTGLVEFDISGLDGLYARGEMQATIVFTIKDGNCWLDLYSMQDANENGTIDLNDIETEEYIGQVFTQEVPSNVISFDVTSALEHDLFKPDQTNYSGFVLKGCEYEYIEIYDHTDSVNAPRLNISDGDDIPDGEDNCPYHYNPSQEDTYPPEGNGVGDACDCEGDFDCDGDCDGTDAVTFKVDFGRSSFNPCEYGDPCMGDFDCDGDVDGTDAALFKPDFGRSEFSNPCPACIVGDWCVYNVSLCYEANDCEEGYCCGYASYLELLSGNPYYCTSKTNDAVCFFCNSKSDCAYSVINPCCCSPCTSLGFQESLCMSSYGCDVGCESTCLP